jgi:hypothetical protein
MSRDDKQRKVVGVYDRPASADRWRNPWIWIALVALIVLVGVLIFGSWVTQPPR